MYSTIRNIYRHRTQQAFDFICVFVNLNIFFKKEKEDRNDFYRFIFSFNTPKPKRRETIRIKLGSLVGFIVYLLFAGSIKMKSRAEVEIGLKMSSVNLHLKVSAKQNIKTVYISNI